MVTYFVVQAFDRGKRGVLVPALPIQATDEEHARRITDRLSRSKAGVIAFSREGDLASGEFEDAKILAAFGQLPPIDGETVEVEEVDYA